MTSVLGRGEIGRPATVGVAVMPITTSLSLGTSSRFRDEPAHPPGDCISARHRQLGRRDRAGWESIGCLCSSEHRRRPRIYGSSRWKKTAKMEVEEDSQNGARYRKIRWSQPPNLRDVSAHLQMPRDAWPVVRPLGYDCGKPPSRCGPDSRWVPFPHRHRQGGGGGVLPEHRTTCWDSRHHLYRYLWVSGGQCCRLRHQQAAL